MDQSNNKFRQVEIYTGLFCTLSKLCTSLFFRYTEDRDLLADIMNLAGKPSDKTIWQTELNSETASE